MWFAYIGLILALLLIVYTLLSHPNRFHVKRENRFVTILLAVLVIVFFFTIGRIFLRLLFSWPVLLLILLTILIILFRKRR